MTVALKSRSFGQLKRQGVRRLRDEWANASSQALIDGIEWYPREVAWVEALASTHTKTPEQVAAIAASLSPRVAWTRAKVLTELVLEGHDISKMALGRGVRKANEILAGVPPEMVVSGPKVTSYYHNLLGHFEWVTIDTHSFGQVSGRDYNNSRLLERNGVYLMYTECFRTVARDVGLEPAPFQAVLWVSVRGRR